MQHGLLRTHAASAGGVRPRPSCRCTRLAVSAVLATPQTDKQKENVVASLKKAAVITALKTP